jgi:hypothetical protein
MTGEKAGTRVTDCEEYWLHQVNSLQSEYKETVAEHLDAAPVMEQVHKVLDSVISLAGCTPSNRYRYYTQLLKAHLKSHERFYIPNYHVYRTDHFPSIKSVTAVAVRKGIPQ